MARTFDLTGVTVKIGTVKNQGISMHPFDWMVSEAKAARDALNIKFGEVRNLCGHRTDFDKCTLTQVKVQPSGVKLSPDFCCHDNCPLLRRTS